MTINFDIFTSVAFWKDAESAKMQQTITVRQHFAGNDSLADRMSHPEAITQFSGDVTLLRLGIGFTKALLSQVLESIPCPLSFSHPTTV